MKRTHLSVPAATPFPVDTIRSSLGISGSKPEAETVSPPEYLDPLVEKYLKPVTIIKGTSRARYKRAILAYDGKIPFTDWLGSDQATVENLQLIASLLKENSVSSRIYLRKMGDRPLEEMRGEMMAHIHMMFLTVMLNGMQRRFKQEDIRSMESLLDEELALNYYLQEKGKVKWHDLPLLTLLQSSLSTSELSMKLFAEIHSIKDVAICRMKLWHFLKDKHYREFCQLLKEKNSTAFLIMYLLTMLEYFHMIDLRDPYWREEGWLEAQGLVLFYRQIREEDYEFLKAHLFNSISIFRKKKSLNFSLMHLLWIKHKIRQMSAQGRSFKSMKSYLNSYKMKNNLVINFEFGFTERFYREVGELSQIRANRVLEEMVEVMVVDG